MKTTRLLAASATALVLALGMTACGSDDADDDVVPAATSSAQSTESAPTSESPSAGSTNGGDGDDVTDADLRGQLEKVALDEVGQGRVTDVERSDDRDHAYEVEVDLGNDDDVSVEIAEDLSVVRVDR
ncbi:MULTISPECIES: hypothetical protein [unclassified Aeromicrobium]|uniref:hypothetical protein n=2 Tax=Aeromicrobium TaxID=2040 RepID=UPI0006FE2BBA|nr:MULTISPECIES: hypothetical protein [unclassified Aeromicrobium]KQO36090.1 hypothetical protein ASF05_07605 [Aeromicrobium sp. Leaf245]KQP78695.1 hypothetical protein ASF37_09240 [Aeromicrobium sp. Leaf289]KQP84405.1 hypothetical protein ASF35_05740 [Aeromicrobium sp. Leaf291]